MGRYDRNYSMNVILNAIYFCNKSMYLYFKNIPYSFSWLPKIHSKFPISETITIPGTLTLQLENTGFIEFDNQIVCVFTT